MSAGTAPTRDEVVRAPLYRDPVYDGATDPTLIHHRATGEWWMFYTQRRATADVEGFAWVHGTDIGVATSSDGGATWLYRGVAEGLAFERGRNTYWAPEVVWHEGQYHMFVSYVRGVPTDWVGERLILHYTSSDLWSWEFRSELDLSSRKVIDAAVAPLPGGGWRMWFKDEADDSHIHAADSPDLFDWTTVGPVITDRPQEGPTVFSFAGSHWMINDFWSGLSVYRSDDLTAWELQDEPILDRPGVRDGDDGLGHHAVAITQGERAFLVYFTEPGGERRARVQVAELRVVDGRLTCDRDAPFSLTLDAARTVESRGGQLPG
ncbi:glycosyl hydrolase [Actinoalloteichus sp. AHMU CJ021]|uniref:Glycosyl hydrolase n=1 Tax=Actinoalloteichus caeruleus DSM 43889 TaxID=1120930 RepID=A0ABT1JBK6_ACTCY|nr:glycosyl hydrolase [Actinoalloteichus caeruleus]AUS80516.1 glycosyl hydrolase [Actinoalloteichus sp. AHMU CJ021]MCP2329874.1 hypothetical protein [Actinoalloteichus caeruleus DSM 43889]